MQLNKLSTLLREITSKHHDDIYWFSLKSKSHQKVCKHKDFCGMVMPSQKDNILKFNKMPYSIYIQTYFLSQKRLYENVLQIFKRKREQYNWFWEEKNITVNKRRTKITWRCKSMLFLWKRNLKIAP